MADLFSFMLLVTTTVGIGSTWLSSRIHEFLLLYPDIQIEIKLNDAELDLACPGCRRRVEEHWLLCPGCRTRLARQCRSCRRTMGLDWTLCGFCGAEFGRAVLDQLRAIPTGVTRTYAEVAALASSSAFVTRVLEQPKLWVIGSDDDLPVAA